MTALISIKTGLSLWNTGMTQADKTMIEPLKKIFDTPKKFPDFLAIGKEAMRTCKLLNDLLSIMDP